MLLSWTELLGCEACYLYESVDRKKGFDAVAVDSRKVKEGTLFFALKGERTDGHLYIEDVLKAGAAGVVVDSKSDRQLLEKWKEYKEDAAIIFADSPLAVLQESALLYRSRFVNTRFIGVTGSSGKTSCKEILGVLFSERFKTVVSPGNLNSEIGLPMALFELVPGTDVAVYEMGINRIGEMAILADLLRPDAVVVTNIGTAHIGMFGSRDKIASEKKKALEAVPVNGFVVIPVDDDYSNFLKENLSCRVLEYSETLVEGYQGIVELGPTSTRLRFWDQELLFAMPGTWNVKNLLGAVSCALEMGLGKKAVMRGIEKASTFTGRNEFIKGDISIYNDCYNANPESMKASYGFFNDWDGCNGNKIAVLGDMGELGEWSQSAHEEMGRWIGSLKGNCRVVFTGIEMEKAYQAFTGDKSEAFYACDLNATAKLLKSLAVKGDCILLKASRSMELEKLIPLIQ